MSLACACQGAESSYLVWADPGKGLAVICQASQQSASLNQDING